MKKLELVAKAQPEQFKTVREFLETSLKKYKVPEELVRENCLVFEEVFLRIAKQNSDNIPEITISIQKRTFEVKITVDYYGERFDMDFNAVDQMDLSSVILNRYADKLGRKYRNRHNVIEIIVKRSYDRIGWWCLIATAAAVLIYLLSLMFNANDLLVKVNGAFIYPLEATFGNALVMIAAPVTFFSLVTNITDCYVIADNRTSIGKMAFRIIGSGIIATILAGALYYVIKLTPVFEIFTNGGKYALDRNRLVDSVSSTIQNIVPKDIFNAFVDISPLPLLLLAILTAAAICTTNTHFGDIKKLNDSIYALFSRILSIIIMVIPIAMFLSILDVLASEGFKGLLGIATITIIQLIGAVVMIAFIGVRVAVGGVNPISFYKKCIPAIVENFKINSTIEALPYNTRFCAKTFGISMNRLDKELPILSQVCQTGNSFMIMISSVLIMNYAEININTQALIVLALLIVLLSIGAPGQDGSLAMGMIIVFAFTGISFDMMAFIIYIEVIMGRSLPVLNTLSSMASLVVMDKNEKKKGN